VNERKEARGMKASSLARWHILFSGRVQHVGFRYTAHYLARGLYVTGWVDNLPDGRVEMEAQGAPLMLWKLVAQLKSQPHIHIEHVEIEKIDVRPHERGFSVRGYSE